MGIFKNSKIRYIPRTQKLYDQTPELFNITNKLYPLPNKTIKRSEILDRFCPSEH
jgi:hypothetical protein